MKKLIYNRYLGELWLWMIFLEWVYYFYGLAPSSTGKPRTPPSFTD